MMSTRQEPVTSVMMVVVSYWTSQMWETADDDMVAVEWRVSSLPVDRVQRGCGMGKQQQRCCLER